MRILIAVGFTIVFLSLGCPNLVEADDSISPRGQDSDAVIPQASPWDSPSTGNPQMEEMNARAAAFNNPQEVAAIMIHNTALGVLGAVNPENNKGSILQDGAFTKIICLPDDGNGGSVVTDDHEKRKIGIWHTNPSGGNYEIEFSES